MFRKFAAPAIAAGLTGLLAWPLCEKVPLRNRLESRLQVARAQWTKWPPVSFGEKNGTCMLSFAVKSDRAAFNALTAMVGELPNISVRRAPGSDALVLLFDDLIGSVEITPRKITMYRDKDIPDREMDAFIAAYKSALLVDQEASSVSGFEKAKEQLEGLGATLYEPTLNDMEWSCLAGYEDVKQQVEDTLLLGLSHPEALDKVAMQTREKFERNRPRAILFEGPPGCGKTTTARIIASTANNPLVYLPVEALMSKWYGESEKKLAQVFEICTSIGAIVFLDEIDSLATSRDNSMHESTRRILSVLLRTMEGFQKNDTQSIVLAATNRKQDLDAALRSRFDLVVSFPLPDENTRGQIFKRYAKQLNAKDIGFLAELSEGMSGRDIMDICKQAERKWVSNCIKTKREIVPPPSSYYKQAVDTRKTQNMN